MVCAVASLAAGYVSGQITPNYDDRPKISVTGEAVVNVKPDQIVINFGIETWDVDILVAKQKNNEIQKETIAAMNACGVSAKDIQTDHLSIDPRWHDGYRRNNFEAYFIRNNLVVTVSDTEKVEHIITKALEVGVNYIHGVDFQTTSLRKYRDEARELALKAAKEKADKMAAALGRSVGAPVSINENAWGSPWRYYSSWWGWGWGSSRAMGMSQVNVQADRGSSGEISETIALGKLAISANVSVVFELK